MLMCVKLKYDTNVDKVLVRFVQKLYGSDCRLYRSIGTGNLHWSEYRIIGAQGFKSRLRSRRNRFRRVPVEGRRRHEANTSCSIKAPQ